MAKKTKSKKPEGDLRVVIDKLIDEVGDDRDRLIKFLDGLIQNYDGEGAPAIAEYVAKIADAMTRQHQVKVAAIKSIAKTAEIDDDDSQFDDLHEQIGLPFKKTEVDDGGN